MCISACTRLSRLTGCGFLKTGISVYRTHRPCTPRPVGCGWGDRGERPSSIRAFLGRNAQKTMPKSWPRRPRLATNHGAPGALCLLRMLQEAHRCAVGELGAPPEQQQPPMARRLCRSSPAMHTSQLVRKLIGRSTL